MEITESIIDIEASPQTVWSVLDDLPRYHEWNPIIPALVGRTTVGEMLIGKLVIPGMPTPPLTPTITRIVAGRELRWLSIVPGDQGFSAEHIFVLKPAPTGTRVVHREVFDGPAAPHLAEPIKHLVRPAYDNFDQALKARSETFAKSSMPIHPVVDVGKPKESADCRKLSCACPENPVEIELTEPIAHNHLCGCSKCWKPGGALLAQIAVIARDGVRISRNASKLDVVDPGQAIMRHACRECGVHMIGLVEDAEHHFFGLSFIHPELAGVAGAGWPEFAGYLSSLIEAGTNASVMASVRTALNGKGVTTYDTFSPELMDIIAYHKRKISSTASHKDSPA